jgi:hypothetical protein
MVRTHFEHEAAGRGSNAHDAYRSILSQPLAAAEPGTNYLVQKGADIARDYQQADSGVFHDVQGPGSLVRPDVPPQDRPNCHIVWFSCSHAELL